MSKSNNAKKPVEKHMKLENHVNGLKAPYRELVERLGELPEKTREEAERRALELVDRVRSTRAGEALEELPERAKDEIDVLLDKVGLMRKGKHEEEIEKAKKRARAAGKRAAKKDLRSASEAIAS